MYKALISFSGVISMACGEVREISDRAIAKDLLEAGYIEKIITEKDNKNEAKAEVKSKPKKRTKKTT